MLAWNQKERRFLMSSRSSFSERCECILYYICSTLLTAKLNICVRRKTVKQIDRLCHVIIRSSCRWWISTSKTTDCTSCPLPSIRSAVVDTPLTRRRRWWPGMNTDSSLRKMEIMLFSIAAHYLPIWTYGSYEVILQAFFLCILSQCVFFYSLELSYHFTASSLLLEFL